jgi:ribonuclease VapC
MGRAQMMVVDSSVIVAIILQEPDADTLLNAIIKSDNLLIAAPTIIEIQAVLLPKLPASLRIVDELLANYHIRIVAFSEEALEAALYGLQRFGKGRHPAKLNFGDCISYGLAKSLNAPLLFKGTDFQLTDVKVG